MYVDKQPGCDVGIDSKVCVCVCCDKQSVCHVGIGCNVCVC